MKKIFVISLLILISCSTKKEKKHTAEISCGQCQFDAEGDGCDLAVRFDNSVYFVDGYGIDDFGDAHDENTGFCNVIRKAEVMGSVENGKFTASKIKLLD